MIDSRFGGGGFGAPGAGRDRARPSDGDPARGSSSAPRIVASLLAAVFFLSLGVYRIYDGLTPDEPKVQYVCPGTTLAIQASPIGGSTGPVTPPPPRLSDEPC